MQPYHEQYHQQPLLEIRPWPEAYVHWFEELRNITEPLESIARWGRREVRRNDTDKTVYVYEVSEAMSHYVMSELFDPIPKPISLRECGLVEVPAPVFMFCQLQEIDLSDNKLSNLPEAFSQLKALVKVVLSDNKLVNVPECLYKLPALKHLDLSNNFTLCLLPSRFFSSLRQLETLYLHNTKQTSLDKSVAVMTSLKVLRLSCNPLTGLPEEFGKLVQLKELQLANCRELNTVASEVMALQQLVKLNLGDIPIGQVPSSIKQLTCLEKLMLSNTSITALPDETGCLSCLKELDVSKNSLTVLPESMKKLRKIEVLNIKDNQLSLLPPWFFDLKSLEQLYVMGNPLQDDQLETSFYHVVSECDVDWLNPYLHSRFPSERRLRIYGERRRLSLIDEKAKQ